MQREEHWGTLALKVTSPPNLDTSESAFSIKVKFCLRRSSCGKEPEVGKQAKDSLNSFGAMTSNSENNYYCGIFPNY